MCLLVCGVDVHSEYSLVLMANRDEFFKRGALKAHIWDKPQIVAGKDLESGGTWIAADMSGRLAAVTNFRGAGNMKAGAPSRGELPLQFLEQHTPAQAFLRSLCGKAGLYNGFNLLIKDDTGIFHFSSISCQTTRLTRGIYGLSNAYLDTSWPKVIKAKEKLRNALQKNTLDDKILADLMRDREIADECDLPNTGIAKELERDLSPMFIKIPGYGTRCTTIVKIKRNGSFSFTEVVYNNEGIPVDESQFFLKAPLKS